MSPGSRCDEVIRLIDEALADDAAPQRLAPASVPADVADPAADVDPGVEELPGRWGVYYLRPSA